MINKLLKSLLVSLLVLSALSAYGARVKSIRWEHPSLLTSNKSYLGVQSVTLCDTATEVQILVRQHQGTFCFQPTTFLLADDGLHYPVRFIRGANLGQWLRAEQKDTVVSLVFAPVPRKTQSIDFIEGFRRNDFRLLGIYSGEKPLTVKPRQIDETKFDATRRNFFHTATATLQGRIEDYDPKGDRHAFTVYFENVITNQDLPLSIDINDDGTFSQKIDLDFPIFDYASCREIRKEFDFYIKPGQTLDVTLRKDGTTDYKDLSGHGLELDKWLLINPYNFIIEAINYQQLMDEVKNTDIPTFQLQMQHRTALCDSIIQYMATRLGYNDFDYKYAMMASHIFIAERYMDYFMSLRYEKGQKQESDSLRRVAETYRPIAQWIDNDILQLSLHVFGILQNRYSFAGFMEKSYMYRNSNASDSARLAEDRRIYGADSPSLLNQVDLLNDIYSDYQSFRHPSKDSIIEQKEVARLEKEFEGRRTLLNNPFFQEKADQIFRRHIEQTDLAYDLPEGEATDLFRRIADKYKGKYLYIDFWATSCGPCKSAIKRTLKMRQELHDNPDLKFIFITGDRQSPQSAYDKFVAEFLADEDVYRVPELEFEKYRNLFKFNGIPHYEALDREGRVLRAYNHYDFYDSAKSFLQQFEYMRNRYGDVK